MSERRSRGSDASHLTSTAYTLRLHDIKECKMAIVVDRSGNNPLDEPWTTFNRKIAGEPNGAAVPLYAGEIVMDTTNNVLWKAMSTTNDCWVALTAF